MGSADTTIDTFLAEEGGYFTDAPRRKKRKSGSHKPVVKPDYINLRELGYMQGRGEIASTTYNALAEVLGFENRTRPLHNKEDGLVECVNRDSSMTAIAIDCKGYNATIYPDHCKGNATEYHLLQRLTEQGFRCDVRRQGKNREFTLVECDPHRKTASVYPKSFADQDSARLWVQALTGLGYQVQTRKSK